MRSLVGAVALCTMACAGARPPQPSHEVPPAPSAARDAGASDAGTTSASAVPPRASARSVKQLASAKGSAMRAFAAGGDLIRVRVEDDRYLVARLASDVWVDEDKLSRGLPRVQKRTGDINGENGVHVCSGVGAVFGKLSERRLWLVENAGGSMICGSSFGEYTIWRWDGGTWSRDAAHSPKPGTQAGGIFATWPIAPGVLGFGVSNLVGDTLQQPAFVMWTTAPNAWSTHAPLTTTGRYVESTCADSSGVVRAFSSGETKYMLSVVSPPGAPKPPHTTDVAAGYRPDGPCAARGQEVAVIEKREAPAKSEALLVLDERTGAWRRSVTAWGPLDTRALAWTASRVVAVADDAEGKSHIFVAASPDAGWSELVGWAEGATGAEILLTSDDDIVVGFHDKAGAEVARIGL
ncbi:MAG: hypothetical protein JWM74_5164 [Myxococcaceae bacterium]|nr:hypothetical protein [Myxococcaceae bacterium]